MIYFYWRVCGMGALLEVGKGISEGTTTYIITEQIERNLKAFFLIAGYIPDTMIYNCLQTPVYLS